MHPRGSRPRVSPPLSGSHTPLRGDFSGIPPKPGLPGIFSTSGPRRKSPPPGGCPRGVRPGGRNLSHFWGYLITLPVGTKYFSFFGTEYFRPFLGHPEHPPGHARDAQRTRAGRATTSLRGVHSVVRTRCAPRHARIRSPTRVLVARVRGKRALVCGTDGVHLSGGLHSRARPAQTCSLRTASSLIAPLLRRGSLSRSRAMTRGRCCPVSAVAVDCVATPVSRRRREVRLARCALTRDVVPTGSCTPRKRSMHVRLRHPSPRIALSHSDWSAHSYLALARYGRFASALPA